MTTCYPTFIVVKKQNFRQMTKMKNENALNHSRWAVVVVEWSACSPFTPTIQVQIPLKPTFFVKWVFEKNKKRPGLGHFQKLSRDI